MNRTSTARTRSNPQARSPGGGPNSKTLWVALCALVAAWIVAAPSLAGDARHVDAITVFQCSFGEDWDVNYDGWPDRWVRKSGPGHPHFVKIAITDEPTAVSKKCVSIELDGAAAAISSPPIRVMPRFSYDFEARLKTESIQHSRVFLALDFCDHTGRVRQTKRSKPFATTSGWVNVQMDAVEPGDSAIDRVIVRLEVERTGKGDLDGRVSLADVRLARVPRIAVSTNHPANVYTERDGIVVRCELSGIPIRDPEIHLQLLDETNNELQSEVLQLSSQLITDESRGGGGLTDGVGQGPDCYEASTEWRPKIADYGYYRVVARMLSTGGAEGSSEADRELASRTTYLAVMPPLAMPKQGEFGWTLPGGEGPLSFPELSRLLPQVGINWVKVPVWFDANDPRRGDELIRFVELLGASNVEVVGIIDRPPPTTELGSRLGANPPVAEVLSLDTGSWAALLEPVMTRLSLRVRWWQLGRDYDTSFVGFPDLHQRIVDLRRALFRFGQDVRLGLNWDWSVTEKNTGQAATWEFQQLCFESTPTQREFDELLARPRENSALRWVFVEPPRRDDNQSSSGRAAAARVSEFVQRLVSAKVNGADAIIVPNPFHDESGLMRANGMPGELLLPWRTTAAMLAGAEYLGQMQLPAGSTNRIFLRPDGQVVMVVWNDEPVREVLYLGNDVRQVDLSGRGSKPEQKGREHVIRVGRSPMYVLGLNEAVTRWRMAASFERRQVPSVFKTPHANSLEFKNFFPQGVGGSLKIVVEEDRGPSEQQAREFNGVDRAAFAPDRWTIEPPQANFQIAAGQSIRFPFEIRLKNAHFGRQPVRVDFKVEADEPLEFSVYGELEVGTEDLKLSVNSYLDQEGTLIVEQLMTNSAQQLTDLKCYLYARGRRPERMQVYRLGPSVDRKVYRFPDGCDLVGHEMLLEIEELNGPRVVRYRFVASSESSPPAAEGRPHDSPSDAGSDETRDSRSRLADVQP